MKNAILFLLFVGIMHRAFSLPNNPDSASFYLKQAVQFKELKKFIDADKFFQKSIQFDPENADIGIEYGSFLIDNRKHFLAVEQFKKILEKDASHAAALQKLTDISFSLRRWSDVFLYGNKLLEKKIGTRVKFMLGRAYYEDEDYGKSQRLLEEAVKETPKDAEAVTLLGKVYIEMSDYKKAIAIYSTALELDPNNNSLIYEFGLLHYTLNKEKEAVKYFELAAEKGYKTDLDYKENLGMAYLGFDIKKGVEILSQVLERKPNDSEILLQIAQAHYKADNFQTAADTFNEIYLHDPTNNKALYMSGMAYQRMGDKVKGTAICDKAIRSDPALAELKRLMFAK